jgi:hypothetical protein
MFKKIALLGVLAAVAAYVGLTFFLGSIVKTGVNSFGPRLTQTKVELAGANISPLTGRGSLRGLSVGNPRGWSDGPAFSLGRVQVDVQPFSIFGDHIVINELIIDEPVFRYETKFVSSNIKDLLKNIEDFAGRGGPAAATKSGQPIRFVVKKFRLTNGRATLGVGAAALPVPLPPVSLDDLGVAEGGITPDQLAGAVMKSVLGSIVTGSAQALSQVGSTAGAATLEKTNAAVRKAGDSLKKLFGDKK